MRLTGTGLIVLVTALGLFALGWWTTDNLLVLVGLVLGTPIVADVVLGRRSLHGLAIERRLPAEVFATCPAPGAFSVTGVRGRAVIEDAVGGAVVTVNQDGSVSATWQFPSRGRRALDRLAVRTRWPLGLVEHKRTLSRPVVLWVAPRPVPGGVDVLPSTDDVDLEHAPSRTGDFRGLRAYADGDPVRAIHWRTTARRDQLVIVERAGEGGHTVVVDVPSLSGDAWERALEHGCGSFLTALKTGPVLLRLDGRPMGPGRDGRFRADVLRALAEARSA